MAETARERRVLQLVMSALAATVATGLLIRWIHGGLGTKLPPFVGAWAPRADPDAVAAAAVLAVCAALAPRARRLPGPAFAAALYAIVLAAGLAVAAARSGTPAWSHVFELGRGGSPEAVNEYLPGLPAVDLGTWFYLDRFAELVPSLPVNVAGHTPGPLLLVHALGIRSAGPLAALCIALGSATAPLTYAIARTVGGEDRARTAGLLAALCPLLLLFGVTSFDYIYAALGALATWLLLVPRPGSRALGCAALALAALFSWALLAAGAFAVLIVAQREGSRAAVRLAAGCAAAVLASDAALAAAAGYDAIGTLRATHAYYRVSLATQRPYAFWLFGSPAAWAVMLGVPITVAAARAAVRGDAAARSLAGVILVAAVAGFTKAETERIWLFMAPWACVAAAAALPPARVPRTLAVLAAQALAVSLLLDTVW